MVPFAREPEPGARVDAGRNRDRERPLAERPALPLAVVAGVLELLARPLALGTGPLHGEEALAELDAAPPAADAAGDRSAPPLSAGAVAGVAALEAAHREALLDAEGRLLEGQRQVGAQVLARGLPPPAPAAGAQPEEVAEDVGEVDEGVRVEARRPPCVPSCPNRS